MLTPSDAELQEVAAILCEHLPPEKCAGHLPPLFRDLGKRMRKLMEQRTEASEVRDV